MKRKAILENLYSQIKDIVLARQHPITGLLPASTSINTHGNYTDAWVRDNVYSILCVWGLSMAYKRSGDAERCDELEQATIKLMRSLLQSMMRQSAKVEKFKHTFSPDDALHAKYDTASGLEVVGDKEWGHLQIDATSLFLLMVAQMSASGLRIIATLSEVDFIQNLVYYVASAYRIEDFGIWERGNKINNGKPEINASSVGMAKAALQALDGLNLFGKDATKRAVIHSVADSISLANTTLKALLPRESLSKETDSALLSIIGFPAFAVGDKGLVTKTRDNILAKLGGAYGCKRFLWDGHQTVLEERSRLYYEHSELANFEHIESEWPLFFTYLYLHALFDGNETTAKFYREKIESLMVELDGQRLIPELYYLPKEAIQAEKKAPGSQQRVPNENVPLVWSQSLYLLGVMLDEGLIERENLDPLNMRGRSLNLYVNNIALVVLAENKAVKDMLTEHGVIAENIQDIEPIQVLTAPALMEVFTQVGANQALGLTGRNKRRLQCLATAQTYGINGKDHLALSWMQSEESDYRMSDARYLAHNIKREINHIRTHWMNREVAVFTWLVDEHFCQTLNADVLFKTLRDLQLKSEYEHVGYASASLALRASHKNRLVLSKYLVEPIKSVVCQPVLRDHLVPQEQADERIKLLLECMEVETELTCYRTLDVFLTQHGGEEVFGEGEHALTKHALLNYIYAKAHTRGHWLVARTCYAVLGHFPIGLGDDLTMLAARHLSITLGKGRVNTYVIDGPLTDDEVVQAAQKLCYLPLERAIVLEVLTILGIFIRTTPSLFEGLRSVQVSKLMTICAGATDQSNELDILLKIGSLSPYELLDKLRTIFTAQRKAFTREIKFDFANMHGSDDAMGTELHKGQAVGTDWLEWRAMRGSITRISDEFLVAIWESTAQAYSLIFGDKGTQDCCLNAEHVRSSMTAGEASFASYIDGLTQQLHPPYYKCAVLEALYAFTEFCRAHPDYRFESPLSFAQLLERAAKSYVWDTGADQIRKRDLDVMLEQSPDIVQRYVRQALEDISGVAID